MGGKQNNGPEHGQTGADGVHQRPIAVKAHTVVAAQPAVLRVDIVAKQRFFVDALLSFALLGYYTTKKRSNALTFSYFLRFGLTTNSL